jgi:hypothetical protein
LKQTQKLFKFMVIKEKVRNSKPTHRICVAMIDGHQWRWLRRGVGSPVRVPRPSADILLVLLTAVPISATASTTTSAIVALILSASNRN